MHAGMGAAVPGMETLAADMEGQLPRYAAYYRNCKIQGHMTSSEVNDVGSTTPGSSPERLGSGSCWVKSSLSFSNGNCVEVASLPDGEVGVRNSRDSEGSVLRFTPDEWHAFSEVRETENSTVSASSTFPRATMAWGALPGRGAKP